VLLAAPALGALALMPRRRPGAELAVDVTLSGSRCFEGEDVTITAAVRGGPAEAPSAVQARHPLPVGPQQMTQGAVQGLPEKADVLATLFVGQPRGAGVNPPVHFGVVACHDADVLWRDHAHLSVLPAGQPMRIAMTVNLDWENQPANQSYFSWRPENASRAGGRSGVNVAFIGRLEGGEDGR